VSLSGLPAPTKTEAAWHDYLRQWGCVVCRFYWLVYTEPEIHHIIDGGKKIGHMWVLPLCLRHHRMPGQGYATRHSDRGSSGKAAFEAAYGTEIELMQMMCFMIRKQRGDVAAELAA
jgi:hypothetical protein